MSVTVQALASSSAGNATLITNGKSAILIDFGLNAKTLTTLLGYRNIHPGKLSGAFLTHLHTDHVHPTALKMLVKYNVPVFCTVAAKKEIIKENPFLHIAGAAENPCLRSIEKGTAASAGKFSILPFPVLHDSQGGCSGYQIFSEKSGKKIKITVATDIGAPEKNLEKEFADSDVLVLEANHDENMLRNCSRPQWLKDRIRNTGHLSNKECGALLKKIFTVSKKLPRALFLAHISQECNTNAEAVSAVNKILKNHEFSVPIYETFSNKVSEIVTIKTD